LWRGFDHGDDPPEEELPGREFAQSAPNFRKDLTVVAVSPEGHYVSYCGMWIVPDDRAAMVEPVATDPDYRGKSLGTAVVVDALRRAQTEGAEEAWVGSSLEFYRRMGFQVVARTRLWVKAR
jgi:predicted N-acetyltransferase YhbS